MIVCGYVSVGAINNAQWQVVNSTLEPLLYNAGQIEIK